MTTEKIIQMIDEYLEEPHSIHKDWVEALQTCRQALLDNAEQKAEINILIRKKETLQDEICELQADNATLKDALHNAMLDIQTLQKEIEKSL